jgi:hypothetical protein
MPAVSPKQRAVMAIAEHNPSKLYKQNRGLAKLPHQALHDFASTPDSQMPEQMENGALPASGGMHYIGHDEQGSTGVFPSGHSMDGVFHHFAKTTGPLRLEDGEVGAKRWIQSAVAAPGFRKGALTAKAHAAGQTPMAFARANKHAGGRLGREANFALNVNK